MNDDDYYDEEEGTYEHFCEICNMMRTFEGNVGCFFCTECGTQTQDLFATAVDNDDIFGENGGAGGLYSQTLHRRIAKQEPAADADHELFDVNRDEKPRDFGAAKIPDVDVVARAIRSRCIEGLQAMIQKLCEVLVETFNVTPLICGIMPQIWLRYVVSTGVYKEGWHTTLIASYKEKRTNRAKGNNIKLRGKKATIKFVLRTLRKLIPIYSTVAISFLSCHMAREPVLPTDIIDWALEAKLPYLSFFSEMDTHIGTATVACPLENRTMFRPALLLGSWQLEIVVGKIAKKVGLHLPPVNFYAVARRWLEELDLPMEILRHACRVYKWLLPVEMYISGKDFIGFPTRVVVMSVMIITLRVLYDINGHGTWEKSLSSATSKQGPLEDGTSESSTRSEFDAKELLRVLDIVHKDIEVKHDHLKDMKSYLNYCKDVISAEMVLDPTLRVNRTIEKCWNIYNKNEDDSDMKPEKLDFDLNGRRDSDDITGSVPFEASTHLNPDNYEKDCSPHKCVVDSSFRKEREVNKMRFEMEQNWFCHLPPVVKRRLKGYISYRRVMKDKSLVYAVHADYYIILRALAKLARVDMRLLHACTLEMERKLAWIEEKIRTSLNVPKDKPEGRPVERREFELNGTQ